jgi:hypothetical protein
VCLATGPEAGEQRDKQDCGGAIHGVTGLAGPGRFAHRKIGQRGGSAFMSISTILTCERAR